MFYNESKTDNGITIVSETMSSVRSITLGIWFRIGSRDESPEEAGMSHFMEHMMFKGTPNRSAADISEQFDEIGAELNAFTSKEYTCFYARFVDSHIERALEIFSDMLINSTFNQEWIDSEREVVIEEIARMEDTPDDYVFEIFSDALMPTNPLGRTIIGTRQSVGSFMQKDCVAFRDRNYNTSNCVVAAAGSINHDELVALTNKYFSAMRQGNAQVRDFSEEKNRQFMTSLSKDTEQAHLVYGMPGIHAGDDDRFAASLLDIALGGGMSSRLFQEVREKRGLAYAVYATTIQYLGAGAFAIYVGTRPDNLSEVLNIVEREVTKIANEGITAEELERVRSYAIGQTILAMEATRVHMVKLGQNSISDLPLLSMDETLRRYSDITLDDIKRVADKIYTQKPTIAIISPQTQAEIATIVKK